MTVRFVRSTAEDQDAQQSGYMGLRQCELVFGSMMGEKERLSFLSIDERDNHESHSEPAPNGFVEIDEISGDVDVMFDHFHIGHMHVTKQSIKTRQQLKFHLELEKAAAKEVRRRLRLARTFDDICKIDNQMDAYAKTLPDWWECRLADWTYDNFIAAEMRIKKQLKIQERKAARAAKRRVTDLAIDVKKRRRRKVSGISEIHVEIPESERVKMWIRNFAPPSARWNGVSYAFSGLSRREQEEVARAAMGLPLILPRGSPRVAGFIHDVSRAEKMDPNSPAVIFRN